jgi:all-trans-retinol dehydrogenase (NAD+)
MSSLLGVVGAAQMTDYCASKAALIALHQSLRCELDNRYLTPGVRTTLVLPSIIKTALFSETIIPTSRLFRFLAPVMSPHTVVDAIVLALERQESSVIRLPWYTQAARLMGDGAGLMPVWVKDVLQWVSAGHI